VLTLPKALMNQAAINLHIATVVREQGESIASNFNERDRIWPLLPLAGTSNGR
jgi:hypothetical protein